MHLLTNYTGLTLFYDTSAVIDINTWTLRVYFLSRLTPTPGVCVLTARHTLLVSNLRSFMFCSVTILRVSHVWVALNIWLP